MLSDSDTSDSDSGIRFKTDSTRNLSHSRHHNSRLSTTAVKSITSLHQPSTTSTNINHHHVKDYHTRRSPSNDKSNRHRSSNDRSFHISRSSYNEKDREHIKLPRSRSRSKSRDKLKERDRIINKDKQHAQHYQNNDRERDRDKDKEREKINKVKPHNIKKNKHKKTKKEKESINEDSKDLILVPKSTNNIKTIDIETIIEKDTFGPMLPPPVTLNVNPLSDKSSIVSDSEQEIDLFGPALPPSVIPLNENTACKEEIKFEAKKPIGPTIPDIIHEEILLNLQQQSSGIFTESVDVNAEDISDEEDESDFVVGPLPLGVESKINLELEKRALELKITKLNHLTNNDNSNQDLSKIREEWMLELPEVKSVTGLGLQARQFRAKAGPDFSDRTMWTDTPKDKIRKLTNQQPTADELKTIKQNELEILIIEKRNNEQEDIIKKHKKKHKQDRNESLLELHQKKISKKKKKLKNDSDDSKLSNRRPFSREVDLKVNHFDDAKKKLLIKKAQLLDTRFSSGHSKFL